MSEKSSFFNAELVGETWDRTYTAEDYANYFGSFIGNGVFPNPGTNLQIVANGDMTITVKEGKAWINGYMYHNDSDLILNIEPADGVLKRIDRIVVRLDFINREITCKVKKGAFASSPISLDLQRDSDIYELGIADILVENGVISIAQSKITDIRLNTNLCGLVTQTVDTIDTSELYRQIQAHIQEHGQEFDTWLQQAKELFENDFNTWFNNVKGILGEDIAGNLLNKINALESIVNNLELTSGKIIRPDGSNVEETLLANKTSILQLEENDGDLTTLQTTNKANLVSAINELFQNVSNGKSSIATAITDKGIPTLATDTFQKMADNIVELSNGKYSLNVKISMQESEPQAPSIGDIWLNTNKNLKPIFSSTIPISPVINDVWFNLANIICELQIDSSLDGFISGRKKDFNINLLGNSLDYDKNNTIALLTNSYSNILTRIGFTKEWDGTKWAYLIGKWWDGSIWRGFTSEQGYYWRANSLNTSTYTNIAQKHDINTGTLISTIQLPAQYVGRSFIEDLDGNVYSVVIYNNGLGTNYLYATKISSTGTVIVSSKVLFNAGGNIPVINTMRYCKDGTLIIVFRTDGYTANSRVVKCDLDFNPIKTVDLTHKANAVFVNQNGTIYILGDNTINLYNWNLDFKGTISDPGVRYLAGSSVSVDNKLYMCAVSNVTKLSKVYSIVPEYTIDPITFDYTVRNIECYLVDASATTVPKFFMSTIVHPVTLETLLISGHDTNVFIHTLEGVLLQKWTISYRTLSTNNAITAHSTGCALIGFSTYSSGNYSQELYKYMYNNTVETRLAYQSSSQASIPFDVATTSSNFQNTFKELFGL